MKTKVFLMLVFGLASLANAVPMELWVAHGPVPGEPPAQQDYYDPVDSELLLALGGYLWVGVYNPVDGVPDAQQKPFVGLGIVSVPDISWTGNWVKYVPPLVPGTPDNYYYGSNIYMGPGIYVDLWAIDLSDGSPATVNLTGVLDAKELQSYSMWHDNAVHLFDGSTGEIIDTIIIHHQHDIPEPATIALLGLGAVMLRKRRRT